MRTTVTLDDDLFEWLETRRSILETSFKEALNEALRAGLTTLEAVGETPGTISRTEPLELGRRRVADVDKVADALAVAESEDYR
jgi:hypothetical protein